MRTLDRPPHLLSTQALRFCVFGSLLCCQASLVKGDPPAAIQVETTKSVLSSKADQPYRTERIRGRIVWLAEALRSEFGITTVPEVSENVLAIQVADGKIFPIIENVRGRAFRKDVRLREMELELSVRVFEKQPFVQLVGIYEVDGEQRIEVDYWCDVCAIVMYEAGPCSCCQDNNRMRKRRVENGETRSEEVDVKK